MARKQSRKPKPRPIRDRILILCEGKTEESYFNDLVRDFRLPAVVVEPTLINTGFELVDHAVKLKQEAKKEKNEFKEIWLVFDKDHYEKHPETFDRAQANKIQIAFSSISFEYWFLLHFGYTTAPFTSAAQLIGHLKENHWPNYKKGFENYPHLRDKMATAIENAKRLCEDCRISNPGIPDYKLNPYTNVWELVDLLIKSSAKK